VSRELSGYRETASYLFKFCSELTQHIFKDDALWTLIRRERSSGCSGRRSHSFLSAAHLLAKEFLSVQFFNLSSELGNLVLEVSGATTGLQENEYDL
jgi:hypothetical protein